MNVTHLISLIRDNDILYNYTNPQHHDRDLKEDVWENIGKELNQNPAVCKSRWNNIRDCYRKSFRINNKTCDGSTYKKTYKYSRQLKFLDKYIHMKLKNEDPSHLEESSEITERSPSPLFSGGISPTLSLSPQSSISTSCDPFQNSIDAIPKKSSRKRKMENSLKEPKPQNTDMSILTDFVLNKINDKNDPVQAFLKGIAPTLRSLNPYLFHLAKGEIFTIVQKYERNMLEIKHNDS